eukprot:scaffold176730_cov28-Tisochrysis_lutea.AAC.3
MVSARGAHAHEAHAPRPNGASPTAIARDNRLKGTKFSQRPLVLVAVDGLRAHALHLPFNLRERPVLTAASTLACIVRSRSSCAVALASAA